MSKDSTEPGSPESPKRRASTDSSRNSEKSTDGNPVGGQSNSPTPSSREEFERALTATLQGLKTPAALAKVVTQRPQDKESKLEPMLVIRDDWQSAKPDCVKFYAVIAYCPDIIEMHNYRTHDAIAIPADIPRSWIKGFKWANEAETERFLDIHAFKESN